MTIDPPLRGTSPISCATRKEDPTYQTTIRERRKTVPRYEERHITPNSGAEDGYEGYEARCVRVSCKSGCTFAPKRAKYQQLWTGDAFQRSNTIVCFLPCCLASPIRARAEDGAWTSVERFYNACQASVMGELEQQQKVKDTQRADPEDIAISTR
jgi:hypothetical protein